MWLPVVERNSLSACPFHCDFVTLPKEGSSIFLHCLTLGVAVRLALANGSLANVRPEEDFKLLMYWSLHLLPSSGNASTIV